MRDKVFSELDRLLPRTTVHQSAAVWGLGGYHYRVFWVHADNYEKFMQGYRKIAAAAQLSSELQDEDLLMAVRLWLQSQPSWLLVLGNADDLWIFGTCLTCLEDENIDFGDEREFMDADSILVGVRYTEKVLPPFRSRR
jgi:hypothetical protein